MLSSLIVSLTLQYAHICSEAVRMPWDPSSSPLSYSLAISLPQPYLFPVYLMACGRGEKQYLLLLIVGRNKLEILAVLIVHPLNEVSCNSLSGVNHFALHPYPFPERCSIQDLCFPEVKRTVTTSTRREKIEYNLGSPRIPPRPNLPFLSIKSDACMLPHLVSVKLCFPSERVKPARKGHSEKPSCSEEVNRVQLN